MFENTIQYQTFGDVEPRLHIVKEVKPVIDADSPLWLKDNDRRDSDLVIGGDRFSLVDGAPFVDATLEGWGHGTFDVINRIPQGLVEFVKFFCERLGIGVPLHCDIDQAIRCVFNHLDYDEPYFLFVDTLVQLIQGGNVLYTYKDKRTGSTYDPSKLEVFEVKRGWDFAPYARIKEILEDPDVLHVIAGGYKKHAKEDRAITIFDVLDLICSGLYGQGKWLYEEVEQWVYNMYMYGEVEDGILAHNEGEVLRFYALTLATLAWLKSPRAVRFLVEVHPVYGMVLDWDHERDVAVIAPMSGGIALVDGTDIMTLQNVEAVKQEPGTCDCCKQLLHCTNLVNLTALKYHNCACGEPLSIDGDPYSNYHRKPICREFREKHPDLMAFACQRCLYMAVNHKPYDVKCGRAKCPAVDICKHHLGAQARLRALTESRVKLLPGRT